MTDWDTLTTAERRLILHLGAKGKMDYVAFMRTPDGLELIKRGLVTTEGTGNDGVAYLTADGRREFEKVRDPA